MFIGMMPSGHHARMMPAGRWDGGQRDMRLSLGPTCRVIRYPCRGLGTECETEKENTPVSAPEEDRTVRSRSFSLGQGAELGFREAARVRAALMGRGL